MIGIDRREFEGKPKDVVHHQVDIRRKKTRDVLRAGDVDALIHLGTMHDPRESDEERHSWNVAGFQHLLEYAAKYGVKKVVVLSSANVYGPSPDNPQFLTEDAPLLGAQRFSAIRDLMEVDMLAQNFLWRHPEIETVVLRPCHILGRVRNAPSNYLRSEHPIMILGFDPMVQVIHERDVVQRDRARARARAGAASTTSAGRASCRCRARSRCSASDPCSGLPAWPSAALNGLWRSRIANFPAPELDHVRYVCMVDDARARKRARLQPPATTSSRPLEAVFDEW